MKVQEKDRSIQLEVLGYEYPPGWGAGMPYETDWLNVRIESKEGQEVKVLEDTVLKFSELNQAYENVLRILEGTQSNYRSDFSDKRFSLEIDIVEDRDIFIKMTCLIEGQERSLCQEVTSEGFRAFVQDLEDTLVSNYRPSL